MVQFGDVKSFQGESGTALASINKDSHLLEDIWHSGSKAHSNADVVAGGALLGTAMLVVASRGRALPAIAHAWEGVGHSASAGSRTAAHVVRTQSKPVLMEAEHAAGASEKAGIAATSSQRAGAATATSDQAPAQNLVTRSTEDIARSERAAASREKAYALQRLDSDVRARVSQQMAELEASATSMYHPISGMPLSRNEQMYSLYVDALPRKTALEFTQDGHLSPGIYRMNVEEFKAQFANGRQRKWLMDNFEQALQGLSSGSVKEVHVGGSFVTRKAHPNDIDFIWDTSAPTVNFSRLSSEYHGALLHHNSSLLRSDGLQMLITAPPGGTYKGMEYFLAHGRAEWQARRRGHWFTTGTDFPKGLVELDLTSMPKQWAKEVGQAA